MALPPQASNANDISKVIATLANRQGNRPKTPTLSGPKRAAILMLALGEQYGGKVWQLLDDDEVRELSMVMSTLGTVEADVVEDLLLEFVSRMSASGALMGTFDGYRTAAAAIPALRARLRHHGRDPRTGGTQYVGETFQRTGRGARQLSQE